MEGFSTEVVSKLETDQRSQTRQRRTFQARAQVQRGQACLQCELRPEGSASGAQRVGRQQPEARGGLRPAAEGLISHSSEPGLYPNP